MAPSLSYYPASWFPGSCLSLTTESSWVTFYMTESGGHFSGFIFLGFLCSITLFLSLFLLSSWSHTGYVCRDFGSQHCAASSLPGTFRAPFMFCTYHHVQTFYLTSAPDMEMGQSLKIVTVSSRKIKSFSYLAQSCHLIEAP